MKKKLNYLSFLLVFFIATPIFAVSCGDKTGGDKQVTPTPTPVAPATISSISPESGKAGTVITITGTKFGTDKSKVKVRFDTKDATNLISVTDTEIKVEAPEGFSDRSVQVKVSVSDVASNNVKSFYYLDTAPPSISSVTGTCFYGSSVVIYGADFSINKQDNIVKFGDEEATVTSATKTSLTVTTPILGNVSSVNVTVTKSDMVSNAKIVPVEVDQNKVATYEWTTTTIRPGLVYKTGEFSLFGSDIRKIHILDVTLNETNKLAIGVSASNDPSTFKSTVAICESYNAIAGVNAGYFKLGSSSDKDPYIRIDGTTVQDGHLNVSPLFTNSALLIHNNVATVRKFTESGRNLNTVAAAIPASQAQDVIVCGPMLLTNNVIESLNMSESHNSSSTGRTGLGVTADGKRVFLVVTEYRTTGAATPKGMSTLQLAKILQALGSVNAMNFDGGGSSTMYIKDMGTNGRVSVNGSSLRSVRSVIYVK